MRSEQPVNLLSEDEVAELARIPKNTLRYYRHVGDKGPKWAKLGRRVFYRESDVLAWIDAQFDAPFPRHRGGAA